MHYKESSSTMLHWWRWLEQFLSLFALSLYIISFCFIIRCRACHSISVLFLWALACHHGSNEAVACHTSQPSYLLHIWSSWLGWSTDARMPSATERFLCISSLQMPIFFREGIHKNVTRCILIHDRNFFMFVAKRKNIYLPLRDAFEAYR